MSKKLSLRGVERIGIKIKSPGTITHKTSETNSRFHLKQCAMGKV